MSILFMFIPLLIIVYFLNCKILEKELHEIYCVLTCWKILRWYYGLNVKCLPQVHVSNLGSPAGGAILGGCGNFRRWGLAGGSRLVGVGHWGCLIPGPFLSCSASYPVCSNMNSFCHVLLPLWCSASLQTQEHRAKWSWTEPSETGNQSKSIPF
jgi:hypothetical protein